HPPSDDAAEWCKHRRACGLHAIFAGRDPLLNPPEQRGRQRVEGSERMRGTMKRTPEGRDTDAGRFWVGLGAAVAGALCIAAAPALANPKGGQVVAGSATIEQVSSTRLDVTQSTGRAIIDWQSFNIGSAQWTAFQQPGAGAVTLNRVEGGNPSVI